VIPTLGVVAAAINRPRGIAMRAQLPSDGIAVAQFTIAGNCAFVNTLCRLSLPMFTGGRGHSNEMDARMADSVGGKKSILGWRCQSNTIRRLRGVTLE
jgi:hypothetical protein